jgi:3',5'-cyclic AMP phosphodiesterase CpdA
LASRTILIAQISDLHITPPGALAYGRVDTAAALLRTIGTLNGLSPRPDLVVISGDIADSAQPEEYAHATKLLGALQMPFAAIPGNHDRRAPMREAFPDSLYGNANCALNTVRRVEGLDIFLMDSTVAGAAHGELDAETLVWLDDALAASATRPAFLFLPAERRRARRDSQSSARAAGRGGARASCRANGLRRRFGEHLPGR